MQLQGKFVFGVENMPDWFTDKVTSKEVTLKLKQQGSPFDAAQSGHCVFHGTISETGLDTIVPFGSIIARLESGKFTFFNPALSCMD